MSTVVKQDIMESIAFVVLCGGDNSQKHLEYFLSRLNVLNKEGTNINEIYVYLVSVSDKGDHIKKPKFKAFKSSFENLTIHVVLGSTKYATEPRAYNYGLDCAMDSPADYFVFLHENDVIVDKNLLDYYMWLFNSAHNPEVIGAVNFSSNTSKKEVPTKVKMWYGDDLYLRGACFKRAAIKSTGPFDESILYRYFEWDLFNRMIHHNGWLTRIGKEDNKFIKFGGVNLTKDYHKLSILTRQSMVWFARKWHHKGLWPEEREKVNCYVRTNTFYDNLSVKLFTDKFLLTKDEEEETLKRFKMIYEDTAIKSAVDMSKTFTKKPIGHFVVDHTFKGGHLVKNNTGIQTHIHSDIKYWDNMFWNAKGVY
jgi:hypothetical protein